MPWLWQPHRLLSRLLGLGTTVWLCRQVGCWAKSLGRLGALVLRFVHRGRPVQRMPDYGHLLLDALYPGRRPSAEAAAQARSLAERSRSADEASAALTLLGEAVLLSPPDASLYLARAQARATKQQLVEALDDAEICVSLDSACADGWLAKGQAEHALGRAADAALSFQAGLRAEPNHAELLSQLDAVRGEPPPNLLRQFRDLVFAARLGLENLFRTVEDPEKTTDAFVEANAELLDAQVGLLAQTLRVNTAVLFDSPMLCDAYEQIVYACSQLVAGAPAAFSTKLKNAPDVIEGLSLALRVGWHVHHSVPKLAANALISLALCPEADDALRRQAIRMLLSGMLRWLLDARPEPDREGEEVCGCSCAVPWKAAACFLERLFEPGRQPWVKEECEAWPDSAQLCQWLTLSVRDYHATPLGLVSLLQLPGVAAAAMRSEARVDFFIPAPPLDGEDSESGPLSAHEGDVPDSDAGLEDRSPSVRETSADGAPFSPRPPSLSGVGDEELALPPAQRLGEWLMASIGYLLLFIEGDILFTVCACRALQVMVQVEPNGEGCSRLLRGLWLGVPLLNKLSLYACSHSAALDLLHCILHGPHQGVRVATRSLAHALARPLPDDTVVSAALADGEASTTTKDREEEDGSAVDSAASVSSMVAAAVAAAAAVSAAKPTLEELPEEDALVPSWGEFYQELLAELACPPDEASDLPEMVTLWNFEEKARLLAEHASVRIVPPVASSADSSSSPQVPASLECVAVPAAWNRFAEASKDEVADCARQLLLYHTPEAGSDVGSEEYLADEQKSGRVVLMSRRSIRQSQQVQNWAQAVAAAERAGAAAVVVFNNLDAMEPFRMGLFGEQAPTIPAFMVSGADGAALSIAARHCCDVLISRSAADARDGGAPPPWPLTGGRLPPDVAQAWSLLEAMSSHGAAVDAELSALLARMTVPEKRVWLTRRLVRHHRGKEDEVDGGLAEPALAFVEGDRSLQPAGQLASVRRQLIEKTGLGADDLCGEFEVRFKDEQGVGSAVLREWMDVVAHEAFLHPGHRLLVSYDRRQTFLPDPAACFCNPQWQLDFEALGRLLGLALWQSCTLDLPLHPHACALLFSGRPAAEGATLATIDEDLHKNKVTWLLTNSVEELGFSPPFADSLVRDDCTPRDEEEAQAQHAKAGDDVDAAASDNAVPSEAAPLRQTLAQLLRPSDLLPGQVRSFPGEPLLRVGAAEVAVGMEDDEDVTDANKERFVEALTEWRLYGALEPAITAMRRGLTAVVPDSVLEDLCGLLKPVECAQLLSGLGEIDVEDWERHCAYSQGLTRNSDLATWFWRAVRAWAASPEDRIRLPQLLQFVTGSARVPVGGFRELVGFNGARHPFTLSRGVHLTSQSLPMAHACICTLDVPPYEDEATMHAKLSQMLSLGRSYFDEAAGHAAENE